MQNQGLKTTFKYLKQIKNKEQTNNYIIHPKYNLTPSKTITSDGSNVCVNDNFQYKQIQTSGLKAYNNNFTKPLIYKQKIKLNDNI